MEVVDETQLPPLVLGLVLTAGTIAASYAITVFVSPNQASINMTYWYMARAAGFSAYLLLAIAVLLGVSGTSALWDKIKARKIVTQVHQFASLLVIPFLALHLWGIHFDTSVPFTGAQLFIPLSAIYRPFSTSLGVLSLYGVLALIVSSYVRTWIGVRAWRVIHYFSFPTFVAVTAHGLLSGTDSKQAWAVALYLTPTILFVIATYRRLQRVT